MNVLLLFWLLVVWCGTTVVSAKAKCNAFSGDSGNVLLFSISANTGKNALAEYNQKEGGHAMPEGPHIPDLFRSSLLNNLPNTLLEFGTNRIVIEMRKDCKAKSWAEFDVSDRAGLDSHNWFETIRLVQAYPYWPGRNSSYYDYFSIQGLRQETHSRSFYINHKQGANCNNDIGFMGIADSSSDPCQWVTNGGSAPVLFYAKTKGPYLDESSRRSKVAYADQFIIYMKNKGPRNEPFHIGGGEVLLFSAVPHSGRSPSADFLNKSMQDKLPTTPGYPALYRSGLLNDLVATAEELEASSIVMEMHSNKHRVAWAEFNIREGAREGLNLKSWFSPKRLVNSAPFRVDNFMGFDISGYNGGGGTDIRTFYMHNKHAGCPADEGLMGIGESSRDVCSWVTNGGAPPVFFYAARRGSFSKDGTVRYADRFAVFLKTPIRS